MRSTVHVDILVPLADNDGRPFPHTAFHTFEHFLGVLVGGFTGRMFSIVSIHCARTGVFRPPPQNQRRASRT